MNAREKHFLHRGDTKAEGTNVQILLLLLQFGEQGIEVISISSWQHKNSLDADNRQDTCVCRRISLQ